MVWHQHRAARTIQERAWCPGQQNAVARGRVCALRSPHINDVAIAGLKTNSLLIFSFLPPNQQISFIMAITGVLVNVHDTDLVLATAKDGVHVKVQGQGINHTDNQRWIAKYKYDRTADANLWSVQNKDTGNYLSWNSSMQVIMSDTEHWWKLVSVEGNIALQVPHATKDGRYYTLELEDDASVTLKNQQGDPISRQLWTPVNE
ncbi:uncharacterized protein F5147DRAFT_308160 [Suillus discolor]|uniref:Uncharacterized protein n=1 Tax=Suillus discolor TaxID=1912936 RepID=A0A9P7JZ89_9AGAM|nr:uncharacterized protein F5147DRAFT_308160 [Suillus discolor]KAG2117322.1 hypothetical protein F5147DRAFT_308160 [Suillus discolor]